MKNLLKLTTRIALSAVVAGGLCLTNAVRGAEATPKADATKPLKKPTHQEGEKTTPAPLNDKDTDFQTGPRRDDGSRDGQWGRTSQNAEVKKFARAWYDHTKANIN